MKIVKHGRNTSNDIYVGRCKHCSCVFEGKEEEMIVSTKGNIYYHDCPNCRELAIIVKKEKKNSHLLTDLIIIVALLLLISYTIIKYKSV